MVQAAWQWAARTKNLRKSLIHGEEEARLVLTDKFEAQDVTTNEISMSGSIDIEDDSGFLLSNDVPNVDADEAALTNGTAATGASTGTAQQMESFSASASFKQLRDQIAEALKGMKIIFKDLTQKQSDALTRPLDKPFSDSILRMFADATKQDLIMNNYVVRSRTLVCR
ncbi:unnamed protein product [Symbiodinium necroappetens]|uniref:Uncharacterized protein n=1 Tax=Symbiodinium necroappetens TaxID=1628268 RepID=A0A812W7J2_9DINO|nr:unnamed protein product [Symbiodinium necroappetens]